MHLFGGNQREARTQIKAHLVAKDATRSRPGPIRLLHTLGEHMLHKVFVLTGWVGRLHKAIIEA